MKKILEKKNYYSQIGSKLILVFSLILIGVAASGKPVVNAAPTVLENELTVPGEGSLNVGIRGEYMAEQQAALDRINEIRLEACQNGYPDPRDKSRKLTVDDYVPIKWSYELERYARIRAAEATIYPGHGRPGNNVYKDNNNRYETGGGEVLAWPGGTLKGGVNQWYGEKETWITGGSGVTGHYTSMISPSNLYVGLGGFIAADGLGSSWGACVSGRFAGKGWINEPVDEKMAPELKDIIQVISIKQEYLSSPILQQMEYDTSENETKYLYVGNKTGVNVVRNVSFDATAIGVTEAVVLDLGSYTYSSADPSVALVEADGMVTAKKAGKAVITAVESGGASYSTTINVKNYLDTPKITKTVRNKKQIKVTFKVSEDTAYKSVNFQVQAAKNKKFTKGVKKATVKPKFVSWYQIATKYTKNVTRLNAKGTYYVRVRAYTKRDGKKYYSEWSKVKKVK
ncbi:MAG: Ig-like domain-containing protein [Lachnospiraceae bacterium]|nr:Ig-like domain-containing protein [Lachnospiraceae bacterium]